MYHDISLSVLLKPSECEIFKTLSRTEMSSSKVFAGSAYLPPLWILLTSNQRVHSHSVPNPSRELRDRIKSELEDQEQRSAKRNRPSVAQQLLMPDWKIKKEDVPAAHSNSPPKSGKLLRKSVTLQSNLRAANQTDGPNVRALQSRILEVHCFQRPLLEPWCIPRGEPFSRAHLLLGIYETVLSILEEHSREDFYSWPLASYTLTTLCMVSRFFTRNMDDGEDVELRLKAAVERLEPDDVQKKIYFDLI